MTTPAVDVKQLSVVLNRRFHALTDVTIQLPAGQIIGFIGPSGAGKTTLMRCLVGRQTITSGQALVLGQPAGTASLRRRLSYMTQETSVYQDLNVRENLHYFATMSGLPRAQAAAEVTRVLQTVDLEPQADQLVEALSGGQKQRVSLAIALIGRPELMVLDEPTVGLDPLLREQLWSLFHDLAAHGTTLIISSHVMDEAERCDELVLIRDGRILAQDSPKQLCTRTHTKSVEQAFLRLVSGTETAEQPTRDAV